MNDSQCVFMDGNPTSIDAVVCVNGTKASTAMTTVQMCGFSIDDVLMFVERIYSFKFALVKATSREVLKLNRHWFRRWIGAYGRRWGWIGVR